MDENFIKEVAVAQMDKGATFEDFQEREDSHSTPLITEGAFDNKVCKMSEELQVKIEKMTIFNKKYCELRARGYKQPDAAKIAGSTAKDRPALGRVGYHVETTVDGAKEYIAWILNNRAKVVYVDENEIVSKLRTTYVEAMDHRKFADAVKAVELLGRMIGCFERAQNQGKVTKINETQPNQTDAFKEDVEDIGTDKKLKLISNMINDLGLKGK